MAFDLIKESEKVFERILLKSIKLYLINDGIGFFFKPNIEGSRFRKLYKYILDGTIPKDDALDILNELEGLI